MTYRYAALLAATFLSSCSSASTQPPPSLKPTAAEPTDPAPIAAEQPPAPMIEVQQYGGRIVQAGLSFWRTEPGSEVFLDGKMVQVDKDGHFAIGFGRDRTENAELEVIYPDGSTEKRTLAIGDREFPISRVDGLPPSKVTPYTEEQLTKIAADREIKKAARANSSSTPYWRAGFDWPLRGRISTKMGAQRILNGEPRRPHSGTDIARFPGVSYEEFVGTPVKAPSTGKVTLAEPDLYFEGGTIFIDHGQGIETVFMHLSSVDVKPGQIVTKGEVVGGVGSTGRSTGPHLHWTLNWNGTPVDPELLVPPMIAPQN